MQRRSLPAWGVWVETRRTLYAGLPPSHSPHGECGLKQQLYSFSFSQKESLPAWGVWVETMLATVSKIPHAVTPRMGSVG